MESVDKELKQRPEKDVKQAKVLVIGSFSSSEIITTLSQDHLRPSDDLQSKIESKWESGTGRFAGLLVRLQSYTITDGRLDLKFGQTDYKEYMGTRDFDTLRSYGIDQMANPVAISSVILTSDNKLLIAQRVNGDATGSIDAIGGFVDPERDLDSDGNIDIFKAAKREIKEEAGIEEVELQEGACIGLSYEYAGLLHPVLSFIFKTLLTSSEALQRSGEEIKIVAVSPDHIKQGTEDYVMDVLKKAYPNVEPDGRITLALARKHLEGIMYKKEILRIKEEI